MADTARLSLGIVPRIAASWWRPGQVVRGLSGMSEAQILAVLMIAMLAFFVSQLPGHARVAHLDPSVPLNARLAGAALAVMFLMPLVAYGAALICTLIAQAVGYRLGPRHARLALFWALLAVAPAMLLAGLVDGFVGPGPALSVTRALAGVGFLVIWGAGAQALAAIE